MSLVSKSLVSQTDSPVSINVFDHTFKWHQVTISRSAVPTVGSVTISGIAPHGTDANSIVGTIDLTAATVQAIDFEGRFKTLIFTIVGLDAGKTIDIEIASTKYK